MNLQNNVDFYAVKADNSVSLGFAVHQAFQHLLLFTYHLSHRHLFYRHDQHPLA
jgi:hypothetical protein